MSTTSTSSSDWVELADRSGDGLEVRLLWDRRSGDVKVTVLRVVTGSVGELDVAPEDALEAFHHPFAYRRGPGARERRAMADAVA